MGANNWTVCPKCKLNQKVSKEKLIVKANKSYGKVELDKFLELMKAANTTVTLQNKLSETYEIGIDDDGEFAVNFGAYCNKCKFSYKYTITENTLP